MESIKIGDKYYNTTRDSIKKIYEQFGYKIKFKNKNIKGKFIYGDYDLIIIDKPKNSFEIYRKLEKSLDKIKKI